MEIKTVAGFINFKMCKLMFKLNLPRDAITQFKAHIEKYKARTGFKELLFEHFSWQSQQFQYFGDLFGDAVKNGLAALQTQHPGIYYMKAAEYLYKRRDTFSQINGEDLMEEVLVDPEGFMKVLRVFEGFLGS